MTPATGSFWPRAGFAFETDNHVFGVVPVPGSAVLMLSGLLGAVFLGRSRKAGQSAA